MLALSLPRARDAEPLTGERQEQFLRFDDRIATLLTLPGSEPYDIAVRWRQLVDVVSRAGPAEEQSAPFIAALAVIRADAEQVPLAARAAAARSIAGRPLADDLVITFAADRLAVNAPILAAVSHDEALRKRLFEVGDRDTRRFLETLYPEEVQTAPKREGPPDSQPLSIQDMVNRIEGHLHGNYEVAAPEVLEVAAQKPAVSTTATDPARAPRAPEAATKTERFTWQADANGEVVDVEGAPRAALIGRDLLSGSPAALQEAMAGQTAFSDVAMDAMGSPWQWSGAPRYDADGNYAGHAGSAERTRKAAQEASPTRRDPQSMRELVHEIRTPLNAIIGFAEIIDGQYLGPANMPYRERAAHIVGQARILLGAIDDLDFAARLQADQQDEQPATLGDIIKPFKPVWRAAAKERDVSLALPKRKAMRDAVVDAGLTGRLVDRMMTGLIEAARGGETIGLQHDVERDHVRMACSRPASLAGLAEKDLLDPALSIDGKLVGLGFSLRLVRGLARIAGGDLIVDPDALILILPRTA